MAIRPGRFASRSWIVPPKLGILAGGGELPGRLVEACRAAGREFFVITFEGEESEPIPEVARTSVGVGAVGKTLKLLRDEGCEEVVLAGPIKRPALKSLKLDWRGARLLPKVAAAKGDDALLSVVVGELEGEGFRVIGADDLLPQLLAPHGTLGRKVPSDEDQRDIDRGAEVLRALGPYDVGQGVVVEGGRVLGIEAAEGTRALLDRIAPLKHESGSGVLVKLAKPGQESRVDRPAIGESTVRQAAAAGLAGIAVEAGGAIIIDLDGVATAADELGLFVVGIVPAEA